MPPNHQQPYALPTALVPPALHHASRRASPQRPRRVQRATPLTFRKCDRACARFVTNLSETRCNGARPNAEQPCSVQLQQPLHRKAKPDGTSRLVRLAADDAWRTTTTDARSRSGTRGRHAKTSLPRKRRPVQQRTSAGLNPGRSVAEVGGVLSQLQPAREAAQPARRRFAEPCICARPTRQHDETAHAPASGHTGD